jgi:DNA polymerase-3 subunit epsilon
MGLSFFKSFQKGLVRLNVSKSGLGLSFGVKGARISVGPRGVNLNIEKNGIRYRKKLDKK